MFDTSPPSLPATPGVGYKPQHYGDILADPGVVGWLEVHAENYMGDGGRPLAQLRALAERFAISVHGVGLSIGGEEPLDRAHLARLKRLVDWLNPASFSEHLAWSSHGGTFFNDLLPLPYTDATLARVADHIAKVQDTLGRRMLLENPATYLHFDETTMDETDFLAELVHRTGCGLLLDVNNVFVACTNRGESPDARPRRAGRRSRRAAADRQPRRRGGRSGLGALRPHLAAHRPETHAHRMGQRRARMARARSRSGPGKRLADGGDGMSAFARRQPCARSRS